MIVNGKNYSEEIKNLLTQNSKNIDERFFGNNSFSLVSLRNGSIQGVPPKVNLDKFIKANKVVKMTGVVIDFSSIPVA